MDRDLAINLVRVTEAAALAAARYLGRGDKNAADGAAVDSMRKMFDTLHIDGEVVIGEGELDEAPMLYIGEKIGRSDMDFPQVDIAVDPIDGTSALAKGLDDSIAVVALAPRGKLLKAPDMYMDKLAVGREGIGVCSLNLTVEENIKNLAKAKGKAIEDMVVSTIDRERSDYIIEACRNLGCRVKLFKDGDVAAALATCFDDQNVDMMIANGGAPEGVVAAAAIKALGGYCEGRLTPMNDEERKRCVEMDAPYDVVLTMDELVSSDDIYFCATGISDCQMVRGIHYQGDNKAISHSLVIRGKTGTVRYVEAHHKLDKKPEYAQIENI
ncbi:MULTISPECIES: class II fructose-bisphosphatase [unclassified Fusibacter]|uniref:class II fructose-bisphosphatase n=1 Tax=unclassified Fusibacter TaxID=2624464 RepID=UPI0010137FFA|nr:MULTISPECIES: class II fructose-bisphosphatase [unclassified Fusibacter]MCK8060572.1 class II fructose-bisphosphatase [Fusibacter sp. A2]NPE22974.1 class II fructose-bisphosphatase [Fusibacter sp. A1]RXV60039.1 class II fructose-bisphosphatase [Fusibacter sp. A1]